MVRCHASLEPKLVLSDHAEWPISRADWERSLSVNARTLCNGNRDRKQSFSDHDAGRCNCAYCCASIAVFKRVCPAEATSREAFNIPCTTFGFLNSSFVESRSKRAMNFLEELFNFTSDVHSAGLTFLLPGADNKSNKIIKIIFIYKKYPLLVELKLREVAYYLHSLKANFID